jgi:hypothetical protein
MREREREREKERERAREGEREREGGGEHCRLAPELRRVSPRTRRSCSLGLSSAAIRSREAGSMRAEYATCPHTNNIIGQTHTAPAPHRHAAIPLIILISILIIERDHSYVRQRSQHVCSHGTALGVIDVAERWREAWPARAAAVACRGWRAVANPSPLLSPRQHGSARTASPGPSRRPRHLPAQHTHTLKKARTRRDPSPTHSDGCVAQGMPPPATPCG